MIGSIAGRNFDEAVLGVLLNVSLVVVFFSRARIGALRVNQMQLESQ